MPDIPAFDEYVRSLGRLTAHIDSCLSRGGGHQGSKVKRLPVVDADGRLAGIIGRADVLAVFDPTDAEIREEIMRDVIQGRLEPSWYSVIVHDGVVTLEGTPETAAIGRDLISRVRHLQGVVTVRDRLVCPDPPVPGTPGPWF